MKFSKFKFDGFSYHPKHWYLGYSQHIYDGTLYHVFSLGIFSVCWYWK